MVIILSIIFCCFIHAFKSLMNGFSEQLHCLDKYIMDQYILVGPTINHDMMQQFYFYHVPFHKIKFLSLDINIVALCCFIISLGRIKNGNTLFRYLVINCVESNYLLQKALLSDRYRH